jgi:hypothetical protein
MHAHVMVHEAGVHHLEHRRIPIGVVRAGALQLVPGIGMLAPLGAVPVERGACPAGQAYSS